MKPLVGRAAILAALLLPRLAGAETAEEFYRGHSITLTIGLPPGGGYDLYGRALAKYYGRHIPGNPAVVPKNMPGGGGIQSANHIFNTAPKDGSEIAIIAASTLTLPLFGDSQAKFDTTKFTWIGSMNDDVSTCGVWQSSPVKKFEDMYGHETIYGSSGPGATTTRDVVVMQNLLGAKTKLIMGYSGTKEVNLAMQRGEIEGSCGLIVSVLKTSWRSDWQEGRLRILIQMGSHEHPELKDVPSIFKYAKSDEDRQVLHLIFDQSILGRPILAPPGLAADRRDALRQAFEATLKDPEFRAEAEKIQLELYPATAAQMEKLVGQWFSAPKAIIDKAKKVQGL